MKALKVLVVAMGVLIVGGLAVVIATVARRAAAPDPVPAAATGVPAMPAAAAPGRPAAFGESAVALPPGAEIVETSAAGGRIVLRLRTASGDAALLVIDAASGRRLGLIRLAPEDAAPR